MKTLIKSIAVTLLLLNGFGAFFGGLNLILAPNGSRMNMPVSMLQYSPFHNFLIPGIVLLIANGIGSIVVLLMMLSHNKRYALMLMAEGAILSGWIIIQVLLIHAFVLLHAVFLSVGILLTLSGWLLRKNN